MALTMLVKIPGQDQWKIYPDELTWDELISDNPYEIKVVAADSLAPSDCSGYTPDTTDEEPTRT